MKNKKIYLLTLLFLVCILSISAISATRNTTNKEIISDSDNKESNLQTNIQYADDVSTSKENSELNLEENNNDKQYSTRTETTTANVDSLTFTDLNETINSNTNSTIYLSNNYKYNNASDNNFKYGIPISRNLTVYGNGVTLDGNNMAKIFNLTNLDLNVKFYNINFINGNSTWGGAIYGGDAYNCNFTKNQAGGGGAISDGDAYNCTFTNNFANLGGAISDGDAYNCTFTNNTAKITGGAIYYGDAYNCTFTNNTAKNGGAIYRGNASNCTFIKNNANIGIAIYNGNATNSTFICYYAPKSEIVYNGTIENCTFQYIKLATKITASPVTTSYYISKMLIITLKDANGNPITNELVTVNLDSAKKYKTDSNGQVKIQVGALTPKTYNAKITYEGSDLYNGSTASVKVTVKKATPKITANAVKYNGKNKQFKVYFLTGHMKHHALKNAQVSLKVNGKTYTVKTNSKGQGIFNINKLKKGKYSAVLSILSNNYYNKVTKNVIINVKK